MDKYTKTILNIEQRNLKSKLEADLAKAKYERQQAMINSCTDIIIIVATINVYLFNQL